jgi:hypothetical protein
MSWRSLTRATLVAVVLATSGCASSISHWIVATRNHQGDVAIDHRNLADASVAYQLALKIDPQDEHARAGLVTVQVRIADADFAASKFDDAVKALQIANAYAPGDDRIDALRARIDQAQIKRDIVVSNYPAYADTGASIRRQIVALSKDSETIANTLTRFNYTFDSNDLSDAIRGSYQLSDELKRITGRLIQYRDLVDSGVPARADAAAVVPPSSLLPLP